jgi:DNA-directed RNA polymerase specialized sigma24 family protein
MWRRSGATSGSESVLWGDGRTAYLLTGDEHLAEDLAQIALTKVYPSWRRISRVDNVDAYVRRVMVNANTGRFRKRRVAEHLSAAPPDGAAYEPHAPLAQRSVLLAELARLRDSPALTLIEPPDPGDDPAHAEHRAEHRHESREGGTTR